MTTAPVILSALQYPEITCLCRVVHITAACDVCGAVVAAIHMPEVTHGFYCAAHCPCRTYSPSEEERRAMERNRVMLKERQQKGAGPKPRRVRASSVPRRKIVAGIRRGKRSLRRGSGDCL